MHVSTYLPRVRANAVGKLRRGAFKHLNWPADVAWLTRGNETGHSFSKAIGCPLAHRGCCCRYTCTPGSSRGLEYHSSDPQRGRLTAGLRQITAAPWAYSRVCTLPLARCAFKASPLTLRLIVVLTVSAHTKTLPQNRQTRITDVVFLQRRFTSVWLGSALDMTCMFGEKQTPVHHPVLKLTNWETEYTNSATWMK